MEEYCREMSWGLVRRWDILGVCKWHGKLLPGAQWNGDCEWKSGHDWPNVHHQLAETGEASSFGLQLTLRHINSMDRHILTSPRSRAYPSRLGTAK